MIVYVESNFVLELAYQQEEHESCSEVLDLASQSRITLAVPAFCMVEPLVAWNQRSARRREIVDRLSGELRELGRSKPYSELVLESSAITSRLVQSTEEEKTQLDNTIENIASIAHVIPMDFNIIDSANDYREQLSLSPQDSIVYSSVLSHLRENTEEYNCFLNRDSKDFMIQEIQEELESYSCTLIPSFINGLGFIRSKL